MKLVSFTLKNFKCFGPDGSTIHFAPITLLFGRTNEDVLAFVRKRMAKHVHIKDRQPVPRDFDPSTVDWEHGMAAWKLLAENKELLKKVNAEMKRIAEASGEEWPYTVV